MPGCTDGSSRPANLTSERKGRSEKLHVAKQEWGFAPPSKKGQMEKMILFQNKTVVGLDDLSGLSNLNGSMIL